MTTFSSNARLLFVAQRVSAMLLAPLVIVHLILILLAVRNGLSAEEILGRTRGNLFWAVFYSVFVIAAAVHAPIGVRNVLLEWTSLSRSITTWLCWLLGVIMLLAGARAVVAVIAG